MAKQQGTTPTKSPRSARSAAEPSNAGLGSLGAGLLLVALGLWLLVGMLHTAIEQRGVATQFISGQTWVWLVGQFGGRFEDATFARVSYWWVGVATSVCLLPLALALLLAMRRARGLGHAVPLQELASVVRWLGVILLVAGAWEWLWITTGLSGWNDASVLLVRLLPLWLALCLAAGLTLAVTTCWRWCTAKSVAAEETRPVRPWQTFAALMVLQFAIASIWMNWSLYFNLRVPHGDSAMYEEHLWNLLHGKGFRSYLDQGLFLGEHIQVVHVLLVPIYLLWPSHLTLELCSTLALAAGAWPVWRMVLRHTGQPAWAACAVAAYALYAPLHFADIEVDLKTFRPEAFSIPLLLAALDAFDAGRWRLGLLWCVGVLTVKEDLPLVLAPLGLYLLIWGHASDAGTRAQIPRWVGLALLLGSVAYLVLATRVLIPYFRAGQAPHYTSYFSRLGATPDEIVRTVLFRPWMVLGELARATTLHYALMLLAPVGFLPAIGWRRLLVGLPLFGVLCLNEVARDPRHQFHAPLVAIVFWALAEALGTLSRGQPALATGVTVPTDLAKQPWRWQAFVPVWLTCCAACCGAVLSYTPLSLTFWDAGSPYHWGELYAPSPRRAAFAEIAPLIPPTARVASTDFVHPRFTHCERSYDYSQFVRRVADWTINVPADAGFLVVDTDHPYSRMRQAQDVPEYRDHPDQWQLRTAPDALFLVFERVAPEPSRPSQASQALQPGSTGMEPATGTEVAP